MGRAVTLCPTHLAICLVLALAFLQLCGKPGEGTDFSDNSSPSLSTPLLPAGLGLLDQILNFTWCVAVWTLMPHKEKGTSK